MHAPVLPPTSSPGLTDWLTAIGTVGAIAIVLLKDWLYAWWKRPKLRITFNDSRQCFHKTSTNEGRVVYYYRVQVENVGRTVARKVEVFARSVWKMDSNGTWVEEPRFTPVWLAWVTMRELGPMERVFLPTIPAKSYRYLDLGHVYRPADRPNLDPSERDEHTPENQTVLSLDTVIRYLRRGHLLGPGRYAIVLEVAAAEAEPEVFTLYVTNPGVWDSNEDKMLQNGVKVESVSRGSIARKALKASS